MNGRLFSTKLFCGAVSRLGERGLVRTGALLFLLGREKRVREGKEEVEKMRSMILHKRGPEIGYTGGSCKESQRVTRS